jgi:hypothetical protein
MPILAITAGPPSHCLPAPPRAACQAIFHTAPDIEARTMQSAAENSPLIKTAGSFVTSFDTTMKHAWRGNGRRVYMFCR